MFTGCGTALVTPFRSDLSLDEDTLRRLVRRQIDAGINFLVPCGTTGESPTLTRAEHLRVVECVAPAAFEQLQLEGIAPFGVRGVKLAANLCRKVDHGRVILFVLEDHPRCRKGTT